MAIPISLITGLLGLAGGVIGGIAGGNGNGARGGIMGGEVVGRGRRLVLIRMRNGNIAAVKTAPRRRPSRPVGTRMDKMLQFALIKSLMKS